MIPEQAVCFYKDGNMWCCVLGDFENLQESPAGFGDTMAAALDALYADILLHKQARAQAEKEIDHNGDEP